VNFGCDRCGRDTEQDEYLCPACKASGIGEGDHRLHELVIADLRQIIAEQDAIIEVAYWNFTRQARAKPPVMVVPEAYAKRRAAHQELAAQLGQEVQA
jgi:hypothetical protein